MWSQFPDERGGFYLANYDRIIAVDADGSLREGWPWLDQRPDPEYGMSSYLRYHGSNWEILPDGQGGIWFELHSGDGDPWLVWQHLTYEGRRIMDEPSGFQGDGIPDGESGEILMTFDGRALCRGYWNETNYLFTVLHNGYCLGEDYIYEDDRSISWAKLRRGNGDLIFSWNGYLGDRVSGYGLLAYDAYDNRFPWGREGVRLAPMRQFDDRPAGEGFTVLTELNNNDLVCCPHEEPDQRYLKLYRVDEDGRLVWNEPGQVTHFAPRWLVQADDNGFWAFGRSNYGGPYNTQRKILYRFDEDGAPVDDDEIDFGGVDRSSPRGGMLIRNRNGYRYIFYQPVRKYYIISYNTISTRGNNAHTTHQRP